MKTKKLDERGWLEAVLRDVTHSYLSSSVKVCPRCRGAHPNLRFSQFNLPPSGFTHWAACPRTGQPILARTLAKDATKVELERLPPKVGSVVSLDVGFGGGCGPDCECKVLKVEPSHDLFGGPRWDVRVKVLGTGEQFSTDFPR